MDDAEATQDAPVSQTAAQQPPAPKPVTARDRSAAPVTPSTEPTDIGCFIRNMRGGYRVDVLPADATVIAALAGDGYACSPEMVNGIWCSDAATVDDVNAAGARLLTRGLIRISSKSLSVAGVGDGWSCVDSDGNSFYLRKDN